MPTQSLIGYRRDIQVLRGLAVVAVVGYHLKVPGFENGFLGVDLFFVISGYLMAAIYPHGQVKSFYLRRARRLLPAYIVTILTTIIVCYLITVPSDLIQVIQQSKSSLALVPNFFFWSQDSYFSKSSFNPLLHLWSLGIEFQFYLTLPILIYLFSRAKLSKFLILILSVGSCFIVLTVSPKTSFFILPFRVWEFVAGILAYDLLGKKTILKVINQRRIFGYFLCVFGLIVFFWFPTNGFSTSILIGHPGIASLIVTILGASYLILAPNIRFGAWLEVLGKYSYSIYLVHFPLIVLIQYEAFSGNDLRARTPMDILIELSLISILAFLLYTFVEQPMKKFTFNAKFLIFSSLLLFMAIAIIPSIKLQQLNEAERSIVEARFDRAQYRCGKIARVLNPSSRVCVVGAPLYSQRIILLGNSHADAIKESFAAAANKNGKTVFFWVQNDPLMFDVNDISEVINQIEAKNISEIYLHYSSGALSSNILLNFIEQIQAKSIPITIIGPVPTWKKSVPDEMWSYRNSSTKSPQLSQSFEEFSKRNSDSLDTLKSKLRPNVPFIDVGRILCTPQCEYQDMNGVLYYWDSDHLTLSGAKALLPVFLKATRS